MASDNRSLTLSPRSPDQHSDSSIPYRKLYFKEGLPVKPVFYHVLLTKVQFVRWQGCGIEIIRLCRQSFLVEARRCLCGYLRELKHLGKHWTNWWPFYGYPESSCPFLQDFVQYSIVQNNSANNSNLSVTCDVSLVPFLLLSTVHSKLTIAIQQRNSCMT